MIHFMHYFPNRSRFTHVPRQHMEEYFPKVYVCIYLQHNYNRDKVVVVGVVTLGT